MAIYGTLGEVDLGALDASIADTAVDVFVYDTRKDSDGGAWRKRTQHTSWYNETLNTATRGSRREFPAVAVIVATAGNTTAETGRKVYIYDGDDPDLPMWMVIDSNDGQWFRTEFSSLSAVNGVIALGSGDSVQPLYETRNRLDLFYFVSDKIESSGSTTLGSYYGTVEGLVNRKIHGTNRGNVVGNSVYPYVSIKVNDVAMTVLPNAPIDPSTGLPIPTIAVATDGGVSVIKDDGSVVDGFTSITSIVGLVRFDGNKVIYAADNDTEYKWIYQFDIPSTDNTGNSYLIDPNSIITNYNHNVDFSTYSAVPLHYTGSGDQLNYTNDIALSNSNEIFVGAGRQLAKVQFTGSDYNTRTSLFSSITSTYNTGWQTWNIKGAFLSDTDATNVTGTELWPEGDFADANEWSSAGAEWTISGGTATVSDGDGGYSFLGSSTGTLTNGKKYVLSFTVSNYSGGRLEASQANSSNIQIPFSANGSYSQLINYTGTTGSGLGMYGYGGGAVGFTLDNLYLRELEEQDRSVNNTGLAVYGTVTKSAVATGAELVAYSGFSNSTNYLSQPLNSDLAIGNSDFSCVGWFKKSTSSNTGMIFYANDGNNQVFDVRVHADMKMLAQITDDGFSTREIVSAQGPTVNDNIWHQFHVVRRSNTLYSYLDGNLLGSSATVEANITNSMGIVIGAEGLNAFQKAFEGSLALIRFSKSAPSAEQIKKMYEDEKVLFQENAACTLYGSSDAVTALAYDDSTNLLYVGTSSGRSDFQGLRRINNTTTAVTTAISASNGLVAEQ